MSLINEMLKDLEARGDRDAVTAAARPAATRRRGAARLPWLLAGGLCIALAAVAAWFLLARAPVPPAGGSLAASMNAAPAPAAPVAGAPAPVAEPEPTPAVPEPVLPAAGAVATVVAADPPAVPPPVEDQAATATAAPSVDDSMTDPASDAEAATEPVLIVRKHEPTAAQKRERAARDGFAALHRSDWSAASRLLAELVALEPANDDAREGLAVALVQQGRLAEADGVLLDGLALGTQPSRFAKLRARVQLAQDDIAAALASLAVAVPPLAADPEFHALRAALAQRTGNAVLARDLYQQLVAHAPGNATWQAGLAMALDQLGERAAAAAAYRRAQDIGGLDAALLAHVQRRLAALAEQ